MLSRSSSYDSIVNSGHYKSEFAIVADVDWGDGFIHIGGETFTASNGLESIDIDWGLFSDAAAIGCVQSRQITVKLRLPKTATVKNTTDGVGLFGRVVSTTNNTSSNWLHLGTFFISRRKRVGESLELTCFDPILKAQADFFTSGENIGNWPRKMRDVAQTIATRIGCTLSFQSSLPDYTMEAPVGMSMRDVLASIAAAWGGNWLCRGLGEVTGGPVIGKKPTLKLIQLGASGDSFMAGRAAASMSSVGEQVQFTGARLFWSDSDCYEAGYGDRRLEAYCEWASQNITGNVWNSINGKRFQAFEASGVWMHPAVEPGDDIFINGVWSKVITMKGSMGAGCALDISFPGGEAEEDEYPYEGPVTKTLQKKVSLGRPYYGATISREQGLTIKRSDGASEAVLNSDIFSMRAKNAAGQMIDCIYFDALAQLYRITGQVEIDGALVTQNLYADEGEIVNLTVDKLLTSRRISKYILGDVSADDYINIQGNSARWINANVMVSDAQPLTEQAKNAGGEALYWTADPTTATVVDGHYEVDGKRVTTTTTNTGWPVTVYKYAEAQSLSITFGAGGGWPVIQFGSGSTNRAMLMKKDNGLQLDYVGPDGQESYILLGSDGRISFYDKLSAVDLSSLDNGTFTMTYDGQEVTYGFEETATGYKLTKPGGEGVVTFVT